MPLVPNYTWTQSKDKLSFVLHLATKKSTSDLRDSIRVSDLFFSFNSAPYLLQIDLFAPIQYESTKVQVQDHEVHVQIQKESNGIWPTINADGPKQQLLKRRRMSLRRASEREAENVQKRLKALNAAKLNARDERWKEEDTEREKISSLKQEETNAAHDEVHDWIKSRERSDVEVVDSSKTHSEIVYDQKGRMAIWEDDDKEDDDGEEEIPAIESLNASAETRPISSSTQPLSVVTAPVRVVGRIETSFSPIDHRAGVVARDAEEQDEFSSESATAVAEPNDEAAEFTEEHSELLKEKGVSFYSRSDFRSACSAFTAALKLDPLNVSVLSNRAASYLQLALSSAAIEKKFDRVRKCIADCNVALSIIGPNKKRRMRSKLLARRGSANSLLGRFRECLSDLEEASILQYHADAALERDIEHISYLCSGSDAPSLESILEEQSPHHSLQLVEKALMFQPCNVQLLIHRASLRLNTDTEGAARAAERDCSEALAVLDDPVLSNGETSSLEDLFAKVLALRSRCLISQGRRRDAFLDMKTAVQFCPDQKHLQQRLQELQASQEIHNHSSTEKPEGEGKAMQAPDLRHTAALVEKKIAADSAFSRSNFAEAFTMYGEALEESREDAVAELRVRLFANRSAAALKLHNYQACVSDCESALALLNEKRHELDESESSVFKDCRAAMQSRRANALEALATKAHAGPVEATREGAVLAHLRQD